jgi:hypothetical protein
MRETYLADIVRAYRNYRTLAEKAIAQVADDQLGVALDAEGNSIAVLMQHVGGNLRSRFADFLTADGEKPDRHRDAEFEPPAATDRAALLARWNEGWATAMGAIEALTPDDLDRTVRIRGEAFKVPEALSRSVTHTAYHVGQIVLLAKHFSGEQWTSLSIPKGQSRQFGTGTFKQGIVPERP